jgi:hypothetical protein
MNSFIPFCRRPEKSAKSLLKPEFQRNICDSALLESLSGLHCVTRLSIKIAIGIFFAKSS